MKSFVSQDVQLISAPSILGFRPGGMAEGASSLLRAGLAEKLGAVKQVIEVPTLNAAYNPERDSETHCLNPSLIRDFSLTLCNYMEAALDSSTFPIVLGGDCSILLGIMPALKLKGRYGLVFVDAHADFYEPVKSTTGEVADMDLAIVTGRGPSVLTNINGMQPYVKDEHVVHLGQRDVAEAASYGSQDIRETAIKCYDAATLQSAGIAGILPAITGHINGLELDGFWLHFDTDMLSEDENPAVSYHLPGGLTFKEVEELLSGLIKTGQITGMSVTIFNPWLDDSGKVAGKITDCLGKALA